jgi:hypothetical protein
MKDITASAGWMSRWLDSAGVHAGRAFQRFFHYRRKFL